MLRCSSETISTNKVYTSILRSLENCSEIDTHTHTHTLTLLKIVLRNDRVEENKGEGKEGRKEGRKERKKEGRKEARKGAERKWSKSMSPRDRSFKIFSSRAWLHSRIIVYYYSIILAYVTTIHLWYSFFPIPLLHLYNFKKITFVQNWL